MTPLLQDHRAFPAAGPTGAGRRIRRSPPLRQSAQAMFAAMALVMVCAGCSKSPSEPLAAADVKIKVLARCATMAKSLPHISDEQIERFCGCSTDKLMTSMSLVDLNQMAEAKSLTDAEKSQAKIAAVACKGQLGRSQAMFIR